MEATIETKQVWNPSQHLCWKHSTKYITPSVQWRITDYYHLDLVVVFISFFLFIQHRGGLYITPIKSWTLFQKTIHFCKSTKPNYINQKNYREIPNFGNSEGNENLLKKIRNSKNRSRHQITPVTTVLCYKKQKGRAAGNNSER